MFLELAESVALLLSLALIYGFIIRKWPDGEPVSKLAAGCAFGFICILGMAFPVTVQPGVFFDARTVVLSMASVFGGPTVGAITGFLAGGYRASIGGDGALVGVTVVVWAVLAGLYYRHLVNTERIKLNVMTLLALGTVIHVLEVGFFMFLPSAVVFEVMSSVAVPLVLTFAPATAFLGLVFMAVDNEINTKHQLNAARLEKARALEQVIHALAAAMEKRDPYTAGHEANVAKIATAIGRELGYEAHRLEGLNLAATVHDIGKIQVPSEILSKPSKLIAPEFELIKIHPQAGADLLKGVEFDWPIAEIILQHHERIDGSGYPQGLKGDQILDEAKILAVADTLEAMINHRPYRAGLGVEAAKQELVSGRGVKYDTDVVDACLSLLSDNRLNVVS